MKIRRVPKLRSFLVTIVSFFSSSRHHQKRLVHHAYDLFLKSAFEITRIHVLLLFFILCLCIVTIFSSGSSKKSNDIEESQRHSNHFVSMLELYPLSYNVDEDMLDDTSSLTNIMAEDEREFIPRLLKVDEEIVDETYSLANVVDEDDVQEFVPRLVHLELIEGATGSHEDYKNVIPHVIHVKLIEGAIASNKEIEEFSGYDEDNDDEGEEDDDDSTFDDDNDNDELTIRIEEFMSKTTRKWKEEMLHDKCYYLEG